MSWNIAKPWRLVAATLATALGLVAVPAARAGDIDYGKPGTPVHLVIGYQPYYTESWSGVVMRGKKLYEKYLPKGSTVDFSIGLQGAVIVNAMLAGKENIGYVGDMPGIVSTTKQDVADIRIVAAIGLGTDECNIMLARTNAPPFASAADGLKWLQGKNVGIPLGSCADRFAREAFKKAGVTPAAVLNQSIEVITSGFRAGKLDAAVVWEPTASRLVQEGLARRIASGATVGATDGAFLTMRADLIKQRPDIVRAWLNAELDAELYVADPKNAMEVARMATEQTTGFKEKMLWSSLYGSNPVASGGTPQRLTLPFAITPPVAQLLDSATVFLHSIKSISVDKLRPEAVMPEFAQQILKERGLTAPVGKVMAMPDSAYTGK
ncbi:MAG: ABC transporter substrate-binding protein [Burkholderiales bacterium]|nr:ABC transporter substrate-binding protein [Burkholderiales bacterium]MDE1926887.1 ABC transporter substrate-binding protein [Burkholderiales bacterium]MDE2159761.1 ABC transporter substrate-binding protein [Burkholderiales bacterium]MDE2505085.1 ABC transporter substrate-binding protein [Burkholderiales bacterium]